MKVWLVWEHFCQSFDIIAEESTTLVGVYASEEAAFCAVEDLSAAQGDGLDAHISYYYEEQLVRE